MCVDPMTMMAVAGMAMSAVGSIQQGNAASAAAQARANEHAANASLQQRQAVIEQTASQYQQRRQGEKLEDLAGRQRNMMATTGLTIEGSPTDVILDSQREGALDIAAVQWNSDLKAGNLNFQSGISNMNAANARQAADTAKMTGYLNAATGLMRPDNFTRLGIKF